MQPSRTIARKSLDDLSAFALVARTRSFTRAAADLGVSNSMLSYTIKRLEERLGIVLLRRTSRSVAPTEAGEHLLRTLEPALAAIDDTLSGLRQERDSVSGTLRITATRQAYEAAVRPVLPRFCAAYPDATVEVIVDFGLRDIVADGFDAGIRLGEKLQKDMVARRIGPDLRMAVVASPAYLERYPAPGIPEDLSQHRCINYRMVTAHTLYAWEFERDGRELRVSLEGPLTFNDPGMMLDAAAEGLGVAYVLEHEAASLLASGRLVRLLEDWTPPFPGFFLYYPSRKQVSPVLSAFLKLFREPL
ncbi:LysR family transcriptional regulator [Paraburkholderia susongensis]|uniref:Transcriptional regulator, LysR family n=1 Tax=Paraburkholderia susongensis TaxID=1515439 RepID=A0A1X7M2W5_9BURK|nr:LysR family transcriptional regulator [Paraburkholderia susongensis]SMG60508.1 transcriptional regulator, LysR family [Paraburkholderia susongensis]